MDLLDIKASEIENNVGHPSSPKKPILVGKGNSICDNELTNASVGLQKQGYDDHEINSCKTENLQGIERNDHLSSSDCTKETIDDLRPSYIISTKRNLVVEKQIFADGSSMVLPYCNGVKGDETPRNCKASPKAITPLKKTSMNSDASLDIRQPLESDLHVGMNMYWLNTGESGLKSGMQATFSDKQGKTESSSSNSSHIILPASSNDSCQETSFDIHSCKLIKINGRDSSSCTDFKSNVKGPATGNLQPGFVVCNPEEKLENTISPGKQCNLGKVTETLDSVRTSSDNVAGISSDNYVTMENIDSLNSDSFKKEKTEKGAHGKAAHEDAVGVPPRVAKEVDQEFEATGSSSSVEGRNNDMIRRSFIDSVDSNRKSCLSETVSVIQQCKSQDKSFTFCSLKRVLETRTMTRNESLCSEVKEPLPDMGCKVIHEVSDGPHGQELSYRTMKAVGLMSHNHIGHLSRIDLNEDVMEHGVDYAEQFGKETLRDPARNVSKPKPVVAKSGVPLYVPRPKVQKELELGGWRGSAANSAFRPTSITQKCIEYNKASSTNDEKEYEKQSFDNSIDLNVAATGVDFDVDSFHDKPSLAESSFPSNMEVGSRQARTLDFDLNCVDGNDDPHQSSLATSLSVRNFDLNDNPTSVDSPSFILNPASFSRHFNQANKTFRSRGSDSPPVSSVENPKQQDFRSLRSTYSADLSSMTGFVPGHVQPFLVATPHMLPSNEQLQRITFLQPQLAYAQQPPHAFRVDQKDILSSTAGTHNVIPYMIDPHSTTILSQVLGSGGFPAFPGGPQCFQVSHGSGPSNIEMTRPNSIDIYNGMNNGLENMTRGTNGGQLYMPSSNSASEEQMKSFQQVGLFPTGMKRREPEGGWDSSQLSFRQMTWR
ncbi:uncharacterized protein LOC133807122 [Humulus lupulus]|uniref:uncharacterized protein LOC133807122 n=1 Tax=Humulus lupulus TaxID=3486 RepID=UPI002B40FA81|nr:uncharacterized protein LOC133807122 [Humulus lupulus]